MLRTQNVILLPTASFYLVESIAYHVAQASWALPTRRWSPECWNVQ